MSTLMDDVVTEWKRQADQGNTRPNVAVANALGVQKRTVETYVYMARKMGQLPETTRGRALPATICPQCGNAHRCNPRHAAM